MALREEFKKQGTWLFRWRSYLPLIGLIMFVYASAQVNFPGAMEETEGWAEFGCLLIAYCGLFIRCMVIGYKPKNTSGRNTQEQVAAVLNISGMYSIVRHPLYLGNFVIWVGVSTFFQLWWLTLLVALIFFIYYERIMFAEEDFLREKFGDQYLAWSEKTPAFIPKLFNWRPPELSFSFKKAVSQEYAGLYAIICVFTFFEIISRFLVDGTFRLDLRWKILFIAGTLIYGMVRFLVRCTSLLKTSDR